MKRLYILGALILGLLPFAFACAPKSTPPPPKPASGTAPSPTPVSTPLGSATMSPADANWAKVVEAAKKEGKVTLYTFFFTDQAQPIGKIFNKTYPEIQLEFMPVATAVRLERLKTEERMGQYIADTSDGSAAFQMNLKKADLLVPIGDLPSSKDNAWSTPPKIDPEGYLMELLPTYMTFWSNTGLLKSTEEPQSLKDLLDPKWKGKIIQVEPATSSMAPWMYTGYTRHGKADDDYFRQMGSQWKWVTGSTLDAARALARGEAPLAWGATSSNNPLLKDGAPVKPLVLQEGALLLPATALSIVKNAPHPNAARVFFNWLLSKEGQTAIAENQGIKSARNDVSDMSPPAARIDWKSPIVLSLEDSDYADQVFSSRKLVDMWGRK